MSKYYGTYSQYLGATRCCNLNSQGAAGPIGPTGPASIGPVGNTGPLGYTGPTGKGCRGATGPPGSGVYTAVATYGTDPSSNGNAQFYLDGNPNTQDQFYSDASFTTLIPIPITLPIRNTKWAINVSIVEFGLDRNLTNLTGNNFTIQFYTDTSLSANLHSTFIFNGVVTPSKIDSYYLTLANNRILGSYNDILDLTNTASTNWYIQLNQAVYNGLNKVDLSGSFQFAITMISLT